MPYITVDVDLDDFDTDDLVKELNDRKADLSDVIPSIKGIQDALITAYETRDDERFRLICQQLFEPDNAKRRDTRQRDAYRKWKQENGKD